MYLDGFDADGCRMTERMWQLGDEGGAVTQSLRCYSPADLRLLLEGTGLGLNGLEAWDTDAYDEAVPLERAMLYLAKLVPTA
jgi:hypothetical protein